MFFRGNILEEYLEKTEQASYKECSKALNNNQNLVKELRFSKSTNFIEASLPRVKLMAEALEGEMKRGFKVAN